MSLQNDEHFVAAVAAALGESLDFIRRRGFHVERPPHEATPRIPRSQTIPYPEPAGDAIDLGAYGIDWDAGDDSRIGRRHPRLNRSRQARAAA